MATLKKINILRNWGRRNNSRMNMVWEKDLKENEEYDLVQIGLEEIPHYYWKYSIGMKCGYSEEEIKNDIQEYIDTITEEEIKSYKRFLADGEKWGWD